MLGTTAMSSTIVRSQGLRPVLWAILLLMIVLMESCLLFSHLPEKTVWFD